MCFSEDEVLDLILKDWEDLNIIGRKGKRRGHNKHVPVALMLESPVSATQHHHLTFW